MATSLRLSRRADAIPPFHVMDILARARQLEAGGRSIIHLEVGEPDFATPPLIAEAGRAAIAAGHTFYTPALGLPPLREAIAGWYATRFGVNVAPERIVVTPGASGALLLALAALLDPGDKVLLTDPGYPCNRNYVVSFGGVPVCLPVTAATGYQLTPEHLQQQPDARVALVATPGNPTGAVTPQAGLAQLAETARRQGQTLIVDEIYQGLTYGVPTTSAAALGEDVWVVNSFSKFFQMTGWRLGWLVAPEAAVPALDRLMQNLLLAAPTPAQHAALAAFAPATLELLEHRREQLDARRRFLLQALPGLGLHVPATPQGAFYVYADVSAVCDDSQAWCEHLLQHGGVALTPGLDFGEHRSRAHVRVAYTRELPVLEQALDILQQLVRAG